jgi:hypothetical protein
LAHSIMASLPASYDWQLSVALFCRDMETVSPQEFLIQRLALSAGDLNRKDIALPGQLHLLQRLDAPAGFFQRRIDIASLVECEDATTTVVRILLRMRGRQA